MSIGRRKRSHHTENHDRRHGRRHDNGGADADSNSAGIGDTDESQETYEDESPTPFTRLGYDVDDADNDDEAGQDGQDEDDKRLEL